MPEPRKASDDPQRGDYIDAHVHVWTDDVKAYPLATGFAKENMIPPRFTPDDLLALSKPLGVNRIVLIQMNFYGFDNSYMLDAIRQHPGVFAGIAQIDEHGAGPACEMKRLKKLGVRGVRIRPSQPGQAGWLDSPGMQAMWSAGAEEKIAMCPLINPEDLPAVDRMCKKFPDTPVVVDHFARIGGDGQFRESDIKQLCGLSRHKRAYVKLSAFYFLGTKKPPYTDVLPMLRRLVDTFGPQRLMWASDNPYQVQPPHTYEASLALIRDQADFLTSQDRQWILERTAAKLFFN
jgi:predicted TIM-barrel fold metal-dependent hydrolase